MRTEANDMKKAKEYRVWVYTVLIAAAACLYFGRAAAVGAQDRHAVGANGKPVSSKQLIYEMIKLDGALRKIVSAVALGDAKRVRAVLKTVHGEMEKTQEGIRQGSIKLPKNRERISEFVEMDEKFHAGLEELDEAAAKNDRQAMLAAAKTMMEGCVNCHAAFRK
jgi:cytochrome c556